MRYYSTWSNGGAGSGKYLNMTGKQYKKNQEWEKKGARTVFEKGQELVLKGRKWVLDGITNGISLDTRILKGQGQARVLFQGLSDRIFTVLPLSSPVFHDLYQKWEKGHQDLK